MPHVLLHCWEMMEAGKTRSATKRNGESKEEDVELADIKGEYFEEENTMKAEFKEEIEFDINKNQMDLKYGSFVSEGEPESNLRGESLMSPYATMSMDIDNETHRVNKTECPFCKMNTEDFSFHIRIFDSCGEMHQMKIYQDGLEAKILSQDENLEAVKLELEVNKMKLTAERKKHEQEMKTAKDKAERDLEQAKIKLTDKKLELTAERERHEEDMKAAQEEVLSHKMRQLLLERDLEETNMKLKDEKKKHKKNLKNFLSVLKHSQSVLKQKKRIFSPQVALYDVSTEVLELGYQNTEFEDQMTDTRAGTRLLERNASGENQRLFSEERTGGVGEEGDSASLLESETTDEQGQTLARVEAGYLFDLPTKMLDFGIELRNQDTIEAEEHKNDGRAGTTTGLLEGNTRGEEQSGSSAEKSSGVVEERDPASHLERERTNEQDSESDIILISARADATSLEDVESSEKSMEEEVGVEQEILERAFSVEFIKSLDIKASEIGSGSKCQENRKRAGGDRVYGSSSDGRTRRQRKRRKLFSEAAIGPQILE